MSRNPKVSIYGVEAELPPGLPFIVKEDGQAILCGSAQDGNSAYRCVSVSASAATMEVFAASAICRWDDLLLSAESDSEECNHAEEQLELWRSIRNAAVKGIKL